MSQIDEDNNLNEDNQDIKYKNNINATKNKAESKVKDVNKKILNNAKVKAFIVAHLPLIIGIIVVIIAIIFIMGLVMFYTLMPGLILGKLDELAGNIWANFYGFFTGDYTTATISKQDVINLAQYMENMGYDIQTYGLGEVTYKEDEKTLNNRNGKSREIEKIGKTVDGKNYLQAYIAAEENTYVLAKFNVFGAVKGAISNLFGNNSDREEIENMDADEEYDDEGDEDDEKNEDEKSIKELSKENSTGMINVQGHNDNFLKTANSSYVKIDRQNKKMSVFTDTHGKGEVFSYDLDNWLSRYGRPKELLLAIHLSTMMPDLAYKIATAQSFNTKVNLGIQDIKVTYTVQATKGDKTITPDQIINLFLEDCFYRSKFSNKTDSEYKNNIKQIEKDEELRDKVFKQIGKQIESRIGQSGDWSTGNAQISISTAEDKAKGESSIATFWKGLFDIDSSLILNNSDEETSNKDWTKKEIVALAELVYKGNLGEEITEDSGTDGDVESGIDNVKWPFIRSVKRHWYYKDIDFTKNTYRFATKATKTIDYESEDEDNILKTNNVSVKLNATFQSDAGIIYQVCEPEATGPNASIIKVFRGRYYRYDGSALTAKKIANTKAIAKNKVTYKYNGEEYQVDNTQDMKVEKQKVNFKKNKTNTLVAFSILENVHTEAADYIYRNLKELVVKLGYFKESELAEELKNILLWPIQTDNQYSTWDVSKDENNWGSTIKCNNNENTVVAPSDAIVEKIEDNSITLKFTTINKDTVKLYDYIYNRIGDNKSYSDKSNDVKSDKNKSNKEQSDDEDIYTFTKINDNILTGMKITIKNIDIDSSIKVNQAISRGQELGTAKQGTDGSYEITITMQNVDKSVVDDLSDYFMQAHNTKYEEIMKYQMENINIKKGLDIHDFGTGSSTEEYAENAGEMPGNSNYAKVYNYLVSKGFSKAAACGILGNIVRESGGSYNPNQYTVETIPDCDPKAQPSGRVLGLYQFTDSNYDSYIDWCNKNNCDKYDLYVQTDYLIMRLRSDDWMDDGSGPYYGASWITEAEFEKIKDPETAASDFCAYYERCGGDENISALKAIRRPWAKKFYDAIPTGIFNTSSSGSIAALTTTTISKKQLVKLTKEYANKNGGENFANNAETLYDVCTKNEINPVWCASQAWMEQNWNTPVKNNYRGLAVYNNTNTGTNYDSFADGVQGYCNNIKTRLNSEKQDKTYTLYWSKKLQKYDSKHFHGKISSVYDVLCNYAVADDADSNPAHQAEHAVNYVDNIIKITNQIYGKYGVNN